MADDLTRESRVRGFLEPVRKFPFIPVLLAATAAAMATAFVYVLIVDDPFGGEPVAVIPIEAPTNGTADDASGSDDLAMRSTLEGDSGIVALPPDFQIAAADLVIGEDPPSAASYAGADELTEPSRHGPIPAIAHDGRRPADVFAADVPSAPADTPRIAILVGGMGLSATITERAITQLPATVTLAFAPYGREMVRLTSRARQAGHELMLQAPLEPYDYPDSDPGPHTLLTGLSQEQNVDHLHWLMSRMTEYVGITNYMGGRFSASEEALRPFLGEIRERGLIYADGGTSPRSVVDRVAQRMDVPFLKADVIIDANPTRSAIAAALTELEEVAHEHGRALGVATGLPAGVDALADWVGTLESKGLVLVPVTALIAQQES